LNKHHFGIEAHHSYTLLPDSVKANRKLLKGTMEMAHLPAAHQKKIKTVDVFNVYAWTYEKESIVR
jgi:hypothetical protein